MNHVLLMDIHSKGFNELPWAKVVMGRNEPEPGNLGAGSLLYKGHMIQNACNFPYQCLLS